MPDGGRRVRTRPAAKNAPHGGVLGSEPPHRLAGDLERVAGTPLIVGGRGIEEPHDVVGRVGVSPRQVGIERDRVEAHGRAVIARRRHHILKSHLGAGGAGLGVVPVVAIRANRENRLARRHVLQGLPGGLHVPGLAGDRSDVALAVVLVVRHQEHQVVRGGVALEPCTGHVDRQRFGGEPIYLVESRVHSPHEIHDGTMEIVGHVLEVHRHSGQPVARDRIRQLIEHPTQRGGRRQQAPEPPGVEARAGRVVVAHHGEDEGAVPFGLMLRRVQHATVDGETQRIAGRHDERPLADHPVQVLGVRRKRGEGVVVPVDVEPGGDRRAAWREIGLGAGPGYAPLRLDREKLGTDAGGCLTAVAQGEQKPSARGEAFPGLA